MSRSNRSSTSDESSSSSASEDCGCSECGKIYLPVRRSLFRRSLSSLNKLRTSSAPLNPIRPSLDALQKHKAQMTSMGYSKLFNLGYFSVTGEL